MKKEDNLTMTVSYALNPAKSRNANLDFLRASAIVMVLVYHISQQWPVRRDWLIPFTEMGQYGVDLFFVLSGWLIGGLYWSELKRYHNVQTFRFIARRSLRTVPPYLVALFISWLGVYLFKHQAFDFGYLFFLQNYYERIPFFLISWSLCVEEHFYLVIPFVLLLIARNPARFHWILLLFVFTPLPLRALHSSVAMTGVFGFVKTATHLRAEGLALGVWASCLFYNSPKLWTKLQQWCTLLWCPALLLFIGLGFTSPLFKYVYGYTLIALIFIMILIYLSEKPAVLPAGLVFNIARMSYSIYLVHAFMLDATLRIVRKTASLPEIVHLLMVLGSIGGAGIVFFYLVEATSLRFRDKMMPKRSTLAGGSGPVVDQRS